MSVYVTALIWKIPLLLPEKVVLLRMADYAGHDGGNIFPSVATIARDCGVSDRAVQLILRKFVGEGLLTIVGNETGGRGKTRHYAIDLERATAMAGPEGEAKRAKRANKKAPLSNGHDGLQEAPETVKRANETAEKGEQQFHPTCQESVSEEEECVELESTRATAPADETHTAAPDFSETKTTNIVQFVPPGGRQPLPARWMPSCDQMAWACGKGLKDPELTILKFRDWWRTKGTAKDAAGWDDAWEWWVRKDVKLQTANLSGAGSDLVKAFNGGIIEIGGLS
jgi:hypothetical protein